MAVATWAVLAAWVGLMSLATFGLAALDKRAAGLGGGRSRVPERTLLGLALAGGSPGLLVAMVTLRHKTRKASFQARFWAVVALQLLAVAAFWMRGGSGLA